VLRGSCCVLEGHVASDESLSSHSCNIIHKLFKIQIGFIFGLSGEIVWLHYARATTVKGLGLDLFLTVRHWSLFRPILENSEMKDEVVKMIVFKHYFSTNVPKVNVNYNTSPNKTMLKLFHLQ